LVLVILLKRDLALHLSLPDIITGNQCERSYLKNLYHAGKYA
jgi:hypothetical protein